MSFIHSSQLPPLPKVASNRDFDFFYQGLEEGRLLVQRCNVCNVLRNPPGPMCPHCQSLQWSAHECKGVGAVHSYTVHHHPPVPGFASPHPIVLVDMEEDVRILGGLRIGSLDDIRIGMGVTVGFERRGETSTFYFRPSEE